MKYLLLLTLTLGFSQLVMADDNPEAPPSVPIDKSAILLLIVGAAYGCKMIGKRNDEKETTE